MTETETLDEAERHAMKITLTTITKHREDYDVEFPIYRLHDTGGDGYGSVHHSRIDYAPVGDKFTCLTITIGYMRGRERRVELTYIADHRFDDSEVDYHLGRGEYACTLAQWQEAMQLAKDMLGKFS